MKRVGVLVLIVLLVVPLWSSPAIVGGFPGPGFHPFHRHGFHHLDHVHHFHHFRGRHFHGAFFFGFGVGALVATRFWAPPAHAYPVYTPAYTYPVYAYPTYAYTVYPPTSLAPAYASPSSPAPAQPAPPGAQGGAALPAPQTERAQPQGAPQASTRNCQSVWVEGHYETWVMPNGQRGMSWVPAHTQSLCQ